MLMIIIGGSPQRLGYTPYTYSGPPAGALPAAPPAAPPAALPRERNKTHIQMQRLLLAERI